MSLNVHDRIIDGKKTFEIVEIVGVAYDGVTTVRVRRVISGNKLGVSLTYAYVRPDGTAF